MAPNGSETPDREAMSRSAAQQGGTGDQEEEDEHHEREVEHARRRDDPTHWPQRPFGEVDEHPADLRRAAPRPHREPGEDGTPEQDDDEDGDERADDAHGVSVGRGREPRVVLSPPRRAERSWGRARTRSRRCGTSNRRPRTPSRSRSR